MLEGVVDYLETEPRLELVQSLQEKIGNQLLPEVCAYYVTSEENAKEILSSGCLLPRNEVSSFRQDLSSSGIQVRRQNKEVWLGDGKIKRKHRLHDCLNFYLNPTNSGVHALCRNQLIMHGLPLRMVVFEFPIRHLARYVDSSKSRWAFSNKNVAKGGYTSDLPNQEDQGLFDWVGIFALDDYSDARASEFLLWTDTLGKAGIPISLARRILASADCKLDHSPIRLSQFLGFRNPRTLLSAEIKLKKFIRYGRGANFYDVLTEFARFQTLAPLCLKSFTEEKIGASWQHGIQHVTRVMFWSLYLSSTSKLSDAWKSDKNFPEKALSCALFHDLERMTHTEDSEHGKRAAGRYRAILQEAYPADSGLICEAIEYHCRPDSDYGHPKNPYFMVLKDADALDRARFGWMCDGVDHKGAGCDTKYCHSHKGCAYNTLRLNYQMVSGKAEWPFRKILAQAACNVAKATKTAPWDLNDPLTFFSDWILRGQKVVSDLTNTASERA